MALSDDERRRIMEMAGGSTDDDADYDLRLAGNVAAPVAPGSRVYTGRGGSPFLSRLTALLPLVLYAAIPVVLLVAGGGYVARYQLHHIDFGSVLDSRGNQSMLSKLQAEVQKQKHKRALLDEAHAFGFANEHMAAIANANKVLAMEPGHPEALQIREESLEKQVVYADGALQQGDVDEAIRRVQLLLAEEPGFPSGTAFLAKCGEELVRRGKKALEEKDYEAAGDYAMHALKILPGLHSAETLRRELVEHHVRVLDRLFVKRDYNAALTEYELVLDLEPDNARAAEVFAAIDERIGFPDLQLNSVMDVGGRFFVFADINGKSAQIRQGETFGNIRLVSVNLQVNSGEVVFEQIHTGEHRTFVKQRGTGKQGESWVSP